MTFAEVRDARARGLAPSGVLRFVLDLCGYGLVSVLALACDYGLLLALSAVGLHYLVAATLSFSAGMAVAYTLSVRFVFPDRRGMTRGVEAGRFVAIGVAGLALTQVLMVLLVARFGWAVAHAKLPTTAVVFVFNFLCRRSFVFSGRR